MSDHRATGLPSDPQAALEILQAELAETNREVMMLTLEMEKRVEARTAEAQAARQQLERTNAQLVALARDLERRVGERTEALRASEERYRLAAERLAAEAHRKDDFLALLGHELRNPLAPIRTAIHLLKNAGEATDTARIHDLIDRQVTHLSRLVDDLLDVSRIARGKVRLQQEPLDLAQLVRMTADDHRRELEAAGLSFGVRLPKQTVWVRGDATRLSQIVGNLLNNARKFTDRGGEVTLTLAADDREARLTVVDTGIGIEPDLLPTLFEPFTQSDQGRGRGGGLGLGLALVRGLAELHEGTVQVASEGIGRGAVFTVTLPLSSAPAAELPAPETTPVGARRILLVEDNADAATTLEMFLEAKGHQVVHVSDGRTALEKAREFRPDIILSDIGLPGALSGYDLAAAVRSDSTLGHPYLIAITGFGQEADRVRALDAGFDVHLIKPVEPRVLERVLAGVPFRRV